MMDFTLALLYILFGSAGNDTLRMRYDVVCVSQESCIIFGRATPYFDFVIFFPN